MCANGGTGVGGMTFFDGIRWTGFNNAEYGLGFPWPFPTDNSDAVAFRPSTGLVAVNPMYDGIHEWNGTSWTTETFPRGLLTHARASTGSTTWLWDQSGILRK